MHTGRICCSIATQGRVTSCCPYRRHTCRPLDRGQNSTRWTSLRTALGIMSVSVRRQTYWTPCDAHRHTHASSYYTQRMPSYLLYYNTTTRDPTRCFTVVQHKSPEKSNDEECVLEIEQFHISAPYEPEDVRYSCRIKEILIRVI